MYFRSEEPLLYFSHLRCFSRGLFIFWRIEFAAPDVCWGTADYAWQCESTSLWQAQGQEWQQIFPHCPWTLYIFRFSIAPQQHHYFPYLLKESGKIFCWWLYRGWRSFWWASHILLRRTACLSDAFQRVGCFLLGIFDTSAASPHIALWYFMSRFTKFWSLNLGFLTFFILFLHLFVISFLCNFIFTFWMSCPLYSSILAFAWVSRALKSAIFLSFS